MFKHSMYLFCKISFVLSVLFAAFCAGAIWYVTHSHIIDFSVLEHYESGRPTIVLDIHGNEWTRFARDKREPVSLQKMSPYLINAFIATEDWAFFKHFGISVKGICRSLFYNLYYGRKVQGASTITQQLVRLLFFDAQKTFSRKIKEQFYALLVEQQFTKEQILQAYLNHVYFGCGIYGVEAASQRFWNKSVSELTIDEAATLAGIVRSPENYCPLSYPLSAQKRRNVVLHSMHKLNFIEAEEYNQARERVVVVVDKDTTMCAPHAKEFLRKFLEELVGKEQLYNGGLVVQTTLDQSLQKQAEKVFSGRVKSLRESIAPDVDGGLLTIDVQTGEIRVMIGGYDFHVSKFNRALQAKRQIGSVFKPLLYAQAVYAGMYFNDTEIDEPLQLPQGGRLWQPKNVSGKFEGEMTLARALNYSNNMIAIKVLLKIGVDRVATMAQQFFPNSSINSYPSLALGCIDATVKDTIRVFNIFANGGNYVEPHLVVWVKDTLGTKIWRYIPQSKNMLEPLVVGQVAKILMNHYERVARQIGDSMDSQALSKTGTTNDSRTCWFAGSTPELTTLVYIGFDDNRAMGKHVYPLRTAFPIWMDVHKLIPVQKKYFTFDPRLKEVAINSKTGRFVMSMSEPYATSILINNTQES